MIQPPNRTPMTRMPLPARSNQRSASFRQHRSSIKREKQENSSRMAEWESWRDNSSYNSTSDTREHRRQLFRESFGADWNRLSPDPPRRRTRELFWRQQPNIRRLRRRRCEEEKQSVQHRPFYLTPQFLDRDLAHPGFRCSCGRLTHPAGACFTFGVKDAPAIVHSVSSRQRRRCTFPDCVFSVVGAFDGHLVGRDTLCLDPSGMTL